ncbi:MAG: alanine dehydrogenase [Gammaproteobacteria bacterium]|nr:alanine dehydrogenase [Gammaproteobacteria bacterium]
MCAMTIGIPKETMRGEGRVALVPADCRTLVAAGCHVCIEQGAGVNSGYVDAAYSAVGVEVLASAEALYKAAQLVVKVKQPLPHDLQFLRSDHTVFSYLHLAPDRPLVEVLCKLGLTAIPFEVVANVEGGHPLLAPMSAVAGRLSIIRGARLLFGTSGGRGVLLGGVDGAERGRVVVIGAGVAGSHAVSTAVGLEAEVHVFDLAEQRLTQLKNQYPTLITHLSRPEQLASICEQADLVVGAVMVPGRRAPVVLTHDMIDGMPDGSVIIDIAIDQGGCVEGIKVTDAEELAYVSQGVIHSAVPNMPGAVPRTAAQSLSAAVAPYVQRLALEGLAGDSALQKAVAISGGRVVDPVLAEEIR